MDIFLVRHGTASATWDRHPDPGLSLEGYRQAESLAGSLLPQIEKPVELISSPLARARETADPLAVKLDQKVHISQALSEIPSPVDLKNRKIWLRRFMTQQWSDQSHEVLAWRLDAVRFVKSLQVPSVLFTHFLLINAIVGQIKNEENTLHFWPANCSITHITLTAGNLKLVSLGDQIRSVVN